MKRRFVTLDVFTDQRYAGNPLAVVLDGGGLDLAAMQTIAGEFNLSETVFVLPPEKTAHRARLRIFTPKHELLFAGHPTVGTAVLLACLDGDASARTMVLEENIGSLSCQVIATGDRGQASFGLTSLPSAAGAPPGNDALASALGLAAADIGFGKFMPSRWSAGVPFIFVPLKSMDAVRRARPVPAQFTSALGDAAVYAFSAETAEAGHDFHARMFAPSMGIAEDPATGAAAAAFAGVQARFGGRPDGEHRIAIEQGYEMGRPSLIHLTVTIAGGALTAVSIGGSAVIVTDGAIEA